MRVWCGGHELGDFDDPLCWIGLVVDELRSVLENVEQRCDERLAKLTREERFALLDRIEFDPHDEGPPDPEPLAFRASVLMHTIEAFDGVKAFLVTLRPGELEVLWRDQRVAPSEVVHAVTVDVDRARTVVASLVDWFEREEARQARQRAAMWPVALVAGLRPKARKGRFAFVQLESEEELGDLRPEATVREREGLTAVVHASDAESRGWPIGFECAWITLQIESELEAVGLTAVVATELAFHNIPCNVVAGFSHDHLFVPVDDGERAVGRLRDLSDRVASALARGERSADA